MIDPRIGTGEGMTRCPPPSPERRRPQGPAAADAVALRASLDPDAYLGTSARTRRSQPRSPTPLTHHAPSGMTVAITDEDEVTSSGGFRGHVPHRSGSGPSSAGTCRVRP